MGFDIFAYFAGTSNNASPVVPHALARPFADVAQAPRTSNWVRNASPWRRHAVGLNLEGLCTNPACQAYQLLVICKPKWKDVQKQALGKLEWQLGGEDADIACPCCGVAVEAISAAVNKCYYKIAGITAEGQVYEGDWSMAPADCCTYWQVNKQGKRKLCLWQELRFSIRPLL